MHSRFAVLASYVLLLVLVGCSSPGYRAEHHAAAFHKLSPSDQNLVLHGHIRPGLSKDAVYIAWGAPDWHFENGNSKRATETWLYERQLTTYAPLGSYDQVYPSLGLYGPRFGYGSEPGFGYGGVSNEGFLYPAHVITTDVRFKRADFVDDTLRQYEVRRGDYILTAGAINGDPLEPGTGTLTTTASAATLSAQPATARVSSSNRG